MAESASSSCADGIDEDFRVKEQRHQPWCLLYYGSVLTAVFSLAFTPLFVLPYAFIGPIAYILGWWRWSSTDFLIELKAERSTTAQIASAAFAKCDELDETFDLSKIKGASPFPAVIFSGGVNVSLQYFGQMYFLKKHGLMLASTKIYGCSTGAPNAALAVIVAESECALSDVKSPLFLAVQQMAAAHRTLKRNAMRILYMGPYYVVLAMRAVMDGLAELLKEHGPPPASWQAYWASRLQIALCRPFSLNPLWMFNDFQNVDEMRDVLSASQLWPMLHAGRPWVRIRNTLIADGGFTNLVPMPSGPKAKPSFVVRRSREKGSNLASEEEAVIEQLVAGYKEAYLESHRHFHASAEVEPVYKPKPFPRSKSIKIVVSQSISGSWLKGIFQAIRSSLTGEDSPKSE